MYGPVSHLRTIIMKTLVDHLAQYAAYHRDRRNIASHFIGIPMIVLAVRITDPADAPAAGQTIMKMPLERLPEAPRPSR